MTDKEQIEEMAKYIEHTEEYECCEPMVSCKDCRLHKYIHMYLCTSVKEAEYLYSKNYRKVERGHWITREEIGDDWQRFDEVDTCSVCGHCDWDCTESQYFNFCPHCGADMRGDGK